MSFNILSPFMGLHYTLSIHNHQAEIVVTQCDGDILPPLVKIELVLAEQGVKTIHLNAADGVYLNDQRLDKIHYYPEQNGWKKEVTYRKAVRFSITEKCNYHCFFCHEEGMEMDVKRQSVNVERFFEIIDQLAELGYDDFTFTGGEPLLNWRGIEACLDHMEAIQYLPEITIVTNGERLQPRMLERLNTYPGKVRFNLSLHSLLNDDYLAIVHRIKKPTMGYEAILDNIKQKMAMIATTGIPFKLNIVLLKGLNTSTKALEAILQYAEQCGASAVKFLELLITENLRQFYHYFYTLDAVKQSLDNDLTLLWQNQKKDVYQYKQSGLEVELQHCPCARGCNTCFLNRGVTFTAEMKFFPCFLRPEDAQTLTADNLAQSIIEGDQYIDKMATYYQDNSPILIKEAYSSKQEKAYYYLLTAEQQKKVENLLTGQLERVREFSEQYYVSVAQSHQTYRKLSINSYDLTALEVYQQLTIDTDGAHWTEFLHDGIRVTDQARYQTAMQEQGYHEGDSLLWSLEYYKGKDQAYSISHNQDTGLRFLRTEKPFTELTLALSPLRTPIVDVIRQAQQQ
ncbi:radical SAM protein [Photobacterium kishitanii]|uniref:radical SAM protein n=1 Tax=Photobacterium kishitanii TaxID=318456 RepID=UPI000D16D5DF|nr:radical SAM protein [Photobacterium kishitanii]PSW46809.1 radical SAM protein [Photobacterium kishitanii]